MQIYIQNDLDTSKPLDHDYNLSQTPDKKVIRLNISYNPDWGDSFQGKLACQLEDKDDQIEITGFAKTIKLDHSELRELLIVLAAYNEDKIEFRQSTLIKSL